MRYSVRLLGPLALLLAAYSVGGVGSVFAQTDTPTVTPTSTPTGTATRTPTSTPTGTPVATADEDDGLIAYRQYCASGTCTIGYGNAPNGHKTVYVSTADVAATWQVICWPVVDAQVTPVPVIWPEAQKTPATITGTGYIEFDTSCRRISVTVSCTACSASAWLVTDGR